MKTAVLEAQQLFLAQPAVAGAVRRLWLGEMLYHLAEEGRVLTSLAEYVYYAALNLALLPLVASTPRVYAAPTSRRGWVRVFGNSTFYLLQVAHFQAFLFTGCDLGFTLLVTMYNDELVVVGLLWVFAALSFEAGQINRAQKNQSVSERLGVIATYLRQDLFNAIDIPTLLLVLASFLIKTYLWLAAVAAVARGSAPPPPPRRRPGGGGGGRAESVAGVGELFLLSSLEATRSVLVPLAGLVHAETAASLHVYDEPVTALAILHVVPPAAPPAYLNKGMSDLVPLGRMLEDVLQFMGLFSVASSGSPRRSSTSSASATSRAVARGRRAMRGHPLAARPPAPGDALPLWRDAHRRRRRRDGVRARHAQQRHLCGPLLPLRAVRPPPPQHDRRDDGRTFSAFQERASQESAVYFARVVADWYDQKRSRPSTSSSSSACRSSSMASCAQLGGAGSGGGGGGAIGGGAIGGGAIGGGATGGGAIGGTEEQEEPPRLAELSTMSRPATARHESLAHRLLEGDHHAIESWRATGPAHSPSLAALTDCIGDSLQNTFGEWETTAFLIERAVTTLTDEIESQAEDTREKIAGDLRRLTRALVASGALPSADLGIGGSPSRPIARKAKSGRRISAPAPSDASSTSTASAPVGTTYDA